MGRIPSRILTALKRRKRALLALVMLVAILLITAVLSIYMEPTGYRKRKDYVDLLAKTVGGIVLL